MRGKPSRRIVLLGASNLTRGISTAVETARLTWQEPLAILAALGHGRSYGMASSVVGRQLPGITECGLWGALRAMPSAPTAAVVTDVGNDLLYGATIEQIVTWVETCLDRLEHMGATVIMTGLPVENLQDLPRARFSLLRSLFFPNSQLGFDQVMGLTEDLNVRLKSIADDRRLPHVQPYPGWYGFDPIHIKMRYWPVAWQKILGNWQCQERERPLARGSLFRWLFLRSLVPETRRIIGLQQRCQQPAGQLGDGTTIAFY